jgi:hypothetical protein
MCWTVLCSTIIRGRSYCTYLRKLNFWCPKRNGNSKKFELYLPIRSFLISTLNFKTPFLNVPFLLSIELLLVNKALLQQSSGAARTYLEKPVCILYCGSIPLMCKYCNDVKCRCHHFRGLSSHEQYASLSYSFIGLRVLICSWLIEYMAHCIASCLLDGTVYIVWGLLFIAVIQLHPLTANHDPLQPH